MRQIAKSGISDSTVAGWDAGARLEKRAARGRKDEFVTFFRTKLYFSKIACQMPGHRQPARALGTGLVEFPLDARGFRGKQKGPYS